MSGHSKWANIRIRKGAQDAKKGKLFTKAAREIIVAARLGGGDPSANSRLRLAIQKAKDVNMPNENVERAIKRGAGELQEAQYEELIYEGYGPGGVALLIEVMTDNRNRTVSEIRSILHKRGGRLGEGGCVAWMFEPKGVVAFDRSAVDEDQLLALAIEAGAEDVRTDEEGFEVLTSPADLESVRDTLTAAGLKYLSAEVTMLPTTTIPLDDRQAGPVLRLLEELEDHDDVQRVHANFDIAAEVLQSLA